MNDGMATSLPGQPLGDDDLASRVLRKVTWRLIPFLCLLYLFNIIDRANVGFAKLTMQGDLGMSDRVFDFGYGIFYFGYLVFEVPSNLLLYRFGARRWIARIMISWGLVTCLTMAVAGAWSFYAVRILLGVAEAGFFPGIVLYLTFWFPARERVRINALFMMAIAFSGVVSNPLSGAIMHYLDQVAGLKDWQWLFLLEGLPSILLGFTVYFCLTDNPSQAKWLDDRERAWLVNQMAGEVSSQQQRHTRDFQSTLVDPRVWLLICVYATVAVGSNAAGNYYPTLLKEQFAALNKFQIGLLGALPHISAVVGMVLIGIHSDRTGERRKHLAFAAFLAAAGWTVAAFAPSPEILLVGLCLAQMGMMSMLPCFWAIPTTFLTGAAAAGGIALINSVANIGGLFGPSIFGWLGLKAMAVILLAGGILALFVQHEPTPQAEVQAPRA